jgi:hypothetical protein
MKGVRHDSAGWSRHLTRHDERIGRSAAGKGGLSSLYLPAQLGYLVGGPAVLGVTLLPYSASMDRQQGQRAGNGRATEFGPTDIGPLECAGRSKPICGRQH